MTVADKYVLEWPVRLADGTLSRNVTWGAEPTSNATLWQDDQFMGLALLARLGRHADVPLPQRARYLDFVAAQHALFAGHCEDRSTGLYKRAWRGACEPQQAG